MSLHGSRGANPAVSDQPFGLTLTSEPGTEPLLIADAKAHLRIDSTEEDAYIKALIVASRQFAETFMKRSIIDQTWTLFLDRFPSDAQCIQLPNPRLSSVASIKFNQEVDGLQVVFDAAKYIVDVNREPGRIALAFDQIWPDTRNQINAVEVEFVAGYGDSDEDVPEEIRHAIKIMVSHLFEVREPIIVGTIVSNVPDSARALLWNHRTF